jgi:site-specific DNA-methyltransferase (adenine-specific)
LISMRITLSPTATLFHADCRDALRAMPDNSVDSVVTDPPYHLTTDKKGGTGAASLNLNSPAGRSRISTGFMGKAWDGGDIAFQPALWAEVLRVLKPGGHVVAFGSSRGYHRMACAIEDAGFEIRDSLMWLYGTGFPKSLDVSKAIDKRKDWKSLELLGAAIKAARTKLAISQTEAARRVGLIGATESLGGGGFMWFETGRMPTRDEWPRIKAALKIGDKFDESFEAAEREVVGSKEMRDTSEVRLAVTAHADDYDASARRVVDITAPATPEAAEWEGWGTALKPAFEPIVLARKPLSEGTVAANVLRWRTGALNIDASRVGTDERTYAPKGTTTNASMIRVAEDRVGMPGAEVTVQGRWPANVVHDGSDEVVGAFPDSKGQQGDLNATGRSRPSKTCYGDMAAPLSHAARNDSGSAARFFYSAKASKADRNGSKHPTVKKISLMEWLCTLITPPGGTILDPFGGSGTTAVAATNRGFCVVLCEREAEYVADIRARFGPVRLNLSAFRTAAALLPAAQALQARLAHV